MPGPSLETSKPPAWHIENMVESDEVGRCPLCLRDGQILRKSHFMPAALYPTKKQLPRSRFCTHDEVYTDAREEVKERLLCGECEGRFSANGESEVLLWLSAKAKLFKLRDNIEAIKPLEEHPELSRYRASDIGIDPEKFAYFAVSVVWRAAIHRWQLPNGALSTQLDLGEHAERIRKYLKGDEPFPRDILAVVVIVSSDQEGREVWGLPAQFHEAGCENFRLVVRGVTFRVALGRRIHPMVRDGCCVATGTVFYGNVAHKIRKDFPLLFEAPTASPVPRNDEQENMTFAPPLEDDIRTLAYALWERRGRPFGSPDEDWYHARDLLEGAHNILGAELQQTARIMQEYLNNYDLVFNERIGASAQKKELGNRDDGCRFCGRSRSQTKFSKIAHAVPEAIGNKAVTVTYECDECNDRFSAFEDDFAKLVLLDRLMSQVRGKGGVPSLKSVAGQSRVDFKDQRMVVKNVSGDEIVDLDAASKTFTIKMPTQSYRPLGVFKALVKMALSLVDETELPNFSEALDWLRERDVGTHRVDDGIGYRCWRSFTAGPRPIPEPHVMIFRRKPGARALYCQFVLAFGNTSFQVSIPSPVQDSQFLGQQLSFSPVPIVASLDSASVRGSTRYWLQSLSVEERISTPRSVTFSFNEAVDVSGSTP